MGDQLFGATESCGRALPTSRIPSGVRPVDSIIFITSHLSSWAHVYHLTEIARLKGDSASFPLNWAVQSPSTSIPWKGTDVDSSRFTFTKSVWYPCGSR